MQSVESLLSCISRSSSSTTKGLGHMFGFVRRRARTDESGSSNSVSQAALARRPRTIDSLTLSQAERH